MSRLQQRLQRLESASRPHEHVELTDDDRLARLYHGVIRQSGNPARPEVQRVVMELVRKWRAWQVV